MADQLVWAAVVMSALVVVYLLGVRFLSLDTTLAQRVGDLAFDLEQVRKQAAAERDDRKNERDAYQERLDRHGADIVVLESQYNAHGRQIEQLHADALETGLALRGHNKDFSALHEHCRELEKTLNAVRAEREQLAAIVAEHKADFDSICLQWREKVGELDATIEQMKRSQENVIRDARNTIAGDLAVASDNLNRKGWRD